MSNKVCPPPMRKSVLLKAKLHKLLQLAADYTVNTVAMVCILGSFGYLAVKAPEIHGAYLRYAVGSKVYMIKGNMKGGGGTGFAMKAPSGQSYIVTNSHVCEGALEQSEDKTSLLVVSGDGTAMRRRIIENSDFTDLCLLEGLPGVNGLHLGSDAGLGSIAAVIGHPRLRPLSISRGEIVGRTDVNILAYIMPGNPTLELIAPNLVKAGKCDLPKNKLSAEDTMIGPVQICENITYGAYMTTIIIWPGNSGSPMVSFSGDVIGVAFASDGTSWAYAVSNADLKKFLSHY